MSLRSRVSETSLAAMRPQPPPQPPVRGGRPWSPSAVPRPPIFGWALGEPHVVLRHRPAATGLEGGGAVVDEFLVQLPGECGLGGFVGDVTEQVRQALPWSQICRGGRRHQPLGRSRSAQSSRCKLSWSKRDNVTLVPSALSFVLAGYTCSACSSRWAM